MAGCRVTPKNQKCGTTTAQEGTKADCKPFEACLGFGRSIVWNGQCLVSRGTPTVADGWYGEVHVVNGCIVDAREAELPVYTPAPCAPAAQPCDENGGGSGGDIILNPEACNLLEYTSGMLDAQLHFGTSTGITVEGCGTVNDPLRFTVNVDQDTVFVKAGNDGVTVTGDGGQATPYTISHKVSPLQAGQYGPFETDRFGHIVGYTADEGAITGVMDGKGIHMSVTEGLISADLKETGVDSGQYTLGGYTAAINAYGQVTDLRRDITITADTYRFGGYDVTVNGTGSITKIEQVDQDLTAIPDTFVGSFRGDTSSTDVERMMTFTTEFDGPFHVEYRGLLGQTDLDPGQSMTFPAGFSITVDDVALTDPLVEVAGVFNMTPGTGQNAIVAIRATSMNTIAAGQHTVMITAPNAIITQRDGFMRVQIVGRGA